jgi:hypothetical protein
MATAEEVAREESAVHLQLSEIRKAIETNTRTAQRSRLWLLIQGATLVGFLTVGALTYWDDQQDDARERDRQEEQHRQDCLYGIDAREDNRQRLLEIAREVGSQRLTDVINTSYQDSAPPAACD